MFHHLSRAEKLSVKLQLQLKVLSTSLPGAVGHLTFGLSPGTHLLCRLCPQLGSGLARVDRAMLICTEMSSGPAAVLPLPLRDLAGFQGFLELFKLKAFPGSLRGLAKLLSSAQWCSSDWGVFEVRQGKPCARKSMG